MPAPQAILDLVERFDRNLPSYRSGQYNETQLRRVFLDPFFFIVLALLALAACNPQAPSPTPVSVAPATQEPATPFPADTDTPEPQLTNLPPQESVTPSAPTETGAAPSNAEAVCFTPANLLPFTFTPDSASILVRGMSGVQVFNLDTLQEERFLQAPQNILTAALSPDGDTLAWALEDNTIQLLRVPDQKILHTLPGHTDLVTKLRFSPDGELLVSAAHDGWVRVWNLQGEELRSFQPPGGVLGIGVSQDGSMLATVPFDGPVALWDLDTLAKIKDLGGTGGYDTSEAEFSADGQYVAASLATGLYLWRISDGELAWNEIKNGMVITFSPDGRYLAYSDIDDNSKVFLSTVDGLEIVHALAGHQGPVWGLFFSPDSQLLVSNDGLETRIWRVEDGSLRYIGKAACP